MELSPALTFNRSVELSPVLTFHRSVELSPVITFHRSVELSPPLTFHRSVELSPVSLDVRAALHQTSSGCSPVSESAWSLWHWTSSGPGGAQRGRSSAYPCSEIMENKTEECKECSESFLKYP